MSDKNRVWVDPHGRALRFLDEIERQRKEEAERRQREEVERRQKEALERKRKADAEECKHRLEAEQKRRKERAMKREEEKKAAKTLALTTQPKAEILPPGSNVPALAPPDACAVPGFNLAEFERQIRQAAKMLNLAEPEGLLDRMFDCPDHRIDVKTDRGRRLAAYVAACTALVQAASGFQNARRQAYLDHLVFLQRVAEEQYKLEALTARSRPQAQIEDAKGKDEFTRRQAERQDAIEDVQAREIVSEHEARIRENGLRGRPAPPPPPPPPAPVAVDEATRKRDQARREREAKQELHLDEIAEAAAHEQEVVSRSRNEAITIYQDLNKLAGDRFERIRRVLETYKVPITILPKAIQEFMEEEEEASTL
jgi:hypothetical protein